MLERSDHGQASQDAFALLSELETREASMQRREAEIQEAQRQLQARSERRLPTAPGGASSTSAKARSSRARPS